MSGGSWPLVSAFAPSTSHPEAHSHPVSPPRAGLCPAWRALLLGLHGSLTCLVSQQFTECLLRTRFCASAASSPYGLHGLWVHQLGHKLGKESSLQMQVGVASKAPSGVEGTCQSFWPSSPRALFIGLGTLEMGMPDPHSLVSSCLALPCSRSQIGMVAAPGRGTLSQLSEDGQLISG